MVVVHVVIISAQAEKPVDVILRPWPSLGPVAQIKGRVGVHDSLIGRALSTK